MASMGPAAVPELIRALQDSDSKVRVAAAEALGKIGPPAAASVPTLIELLDDEDSWLRAAETLGQIGREARAAVPKLLAKLEGMQPLSGSHDYLAVIQALGGIGPEARPAVPAILRASNFEDACMAAVVSLARIDPANASVVPRLRDLIARMGRIPNLGFSLTPPGCGFFGQLVEVIWELGPRAEELAPDLERLVTAPLLDRRVRCYAAFALARFASSRPTAVGYLKREAASDYLMLCASYVPARSPYSVPELDFASALLQRINDAATDQ
jgi:HEAT repeat protein